MKPNFLLLLLIELCVAVSAHAQYKTAEVEGRTCLLYPSGVLADFLREQNLPDGDWAGQYRGRNEGVLAFRATIYNGVVEGLCRQYYESGSVKSIESFSAGKRVGTSMFFFESGTQSGEINFVNDVQHGAFVYNDAQGMPLRSGEYYQGRNHGDWQWWYTNSAQLRKKHAYVNGSPSGKWTEWFPNGRLKAESYYIDSVLANRPDLPPPYPDGIWTTWYLNGKPQSYLYYTDFQLAKRETYFEEGMLATRMLYMQGAPTYSVSFWKNGDTMEVTSYVPVTIPEGTASIAASGTNGETTQTNTEERTSVKTGRAVAWHENGKKRFEGTYKDGLREGEWRYWDNKGVLIKKVEYYQDKVIRENVFHKG